MSDVIAYFITWTTYGTWLPGDERGWTQWHQGWKAPDKSLADYSRSIMTEDAVTLQTVQRQLVEGTIVKHSNIRNWKLWAKNCRTNHVHVVVTAYRYDGETVRDQFKAWCTRLLKSEFNPKKTNWWTEGGYVKPIDNEDDLSAAIRYTLEAQ